MKQFEIYSHLPIPFQNLLCSLYGYKLEHQRYNKEYYKIYESLLYSDSWSKDKIRGYKEEHLNKIIEYAFKHCPYYRQRFKSAGLSPNDFAGLESLLKFPILTKEDVRANWKGMLSDEYNTKQLIPYHTSGSTGKALDFYWTKFNLQFYWAIVWRGRHRFDVNKGDCHLNFTGKIVAPISQSRPPYWRYNRPLNQYMLNMQQLTQNKIADTVNFINNTDIRFFVGYPSIMNTFASLVIDNGLNVKNSPSYIFSSAEKMYDMQKQNILRVFPQTKIIEHYGFSENAASASKCKNDVYHEDFELGHLELNRPEKTGKCLTGPMVATGFQNFAMPFIRYEIGDIGTFSSERCTCGINSQVITDIEGRSEDYIITPEGSQIMRLDYIFKNTDSIKESQIIQNQLGSIVLKIVRRKNYSEKDELELKHNIQTMISPTIGVDFEYVDEIPRTKSGKFKAVVSNLKK